MGLDADDFTGRRVLVADDNELEREVVVNLVEALGATCTAVADGDALAEKLLGPSAEDFDIVLTDEHMPGRNGLDVCAAYRASSRADAATLPFVGMSADADPALYDRAVAAGLNAMMLKPVQKSVLAAYFTTLIKDHRANSVFSARIREMSRLLRNSTLIGKAMAALQAAETREDPSSFLALVMEGLKAADCRLVRFDLAADRAVVDVRCAVKFGGVVDDLMREIKVSAVPSVRERLFDDGFCRLQGDEVSRLLDAYGVTVDETRRAYQDIYLVLIRVREEPWGCLSISYQQSVEFEKEDVMLLRRMALVLGTALERRETYRELERAKNVAVEDARFLNEVMNAFPMPCLVWNEAGVMLRCNAAYGRLMNRDPADFEGKSLKDLFGAGADAVDRFHRACLAKNEISVSDERFSFDVARRRMFTRHAMPIMTEKGERVLLCVLEDVTDSREREELIARQAEVLREERDHAVAAEKAKSYFFSTVSHDIRTPLNAIIGYSQILKLGIEDAEERKRAVDSIVTSGNVLLQLINDVLDLSKLEAGKMEINRQPTDCARLVTGVVDAFRAASASRSVVPSAKIAPMPYLQLDEQRVRQILFNLVGNAMKFTEQGTVEVTAAFAVPPEEAAKRTRDYGCAGVLELEVRDTGCGISAEDQQRIAQPYVQVGNRTARNGGTGLGLAIVKQLVFRMDGEIELSSQPGVGTTFRVHIPAVEVPAAVHLKNVSVTQMLKAVVAPGANTDARILVVDDSSVNRTVLCSMLKRLGYANVATAANGVEALEAIRREKPTRMRAPRWAQTAFDLVLTDMWMPEMDGEAFVRAVRADSALARLPVYAVTADVEAQKNFAEKGFTGILLKPVTLESLKNLLVT